MITINTKSREVNLLGTHPKTKRDYDKREKEKTANHIKIAKEFGYDFFDGSRAVGYGGYSYDGRWLPFVKKIKEHYLLPDNASILDIGCAKGFFLHDFKTLYPKSSLSGVDISAYAIENSMESIKQNLQVACVSSLPFPDNSFDFVLSINSIHNLPLSLLKKALKEINRVSKQHAYITVDAWRSKQEREQLYKWVLTAESMMHVEDWKKLFDEVGYKGDYWWFIAD